MHNSHSELLCLIFGYKDPDKSITKGIDKKVCCVYRVIRHLQRPSRIDIALHFQTMNVLTISFSEHPYC